MFLTTLKDPKVSVSNTEHTTSVINFVKYKLSYD